MKSINELPKNAFGEPLKYHFTIVDYGTGIKREQNRLEPNIAEFLAEMARWDDLELKAIKLTRENMLTGELVVYSTIKDLIEVRRQAYDLLEIETLELERAKKALKG